MLHPQKARLAAIRELRRLARPAGEFDASRYFRGADTLGFFNVGAKAIRALAPNEAARLVPLDTPTPKAVKA